ncbi:hypothetical protein JCM8097_003327 [Rhodosporidiobolus ruineniae]
MSSQLLVQVPNTKLAHLAGGDDVLLFEGTVSLTLHRLPSSSQHPASIASTSKQPPALPPRPGSASTTPPPPAYSASSSPTSTPSDYLELTLILPGDHDPAFSMPVSLRDPASSIVAVPPASYILPNLTGVDPSSLDRVASSTDSKGLPRGTEEGFIKLTLPHPAAAEGTTLDPETRELFEAALFGLYRGQDASSSVGRPGMSSHPSANQLYLVDETTGQVLGELETEGMVLQEDAQLAAGQTADEKPVPPAAHVSGAPSLAVEGHEAVVIDSLEPVSAGDAPSVRYSVTPISTYSPAANPQNSSVISAANYLSRGIIVGSEILSRAFESGAGKYVASRPASKTPLVFKPETRARFEQGNRVTQQATVYSGKAAAAVGRVAGALGNKIGKSTGIQSKPGGAPPTGWRGALASTLTAVNTVADHLEAGGKTLLDSGSKSASNMIHHSYGAEARDVADNVGGSVKHCALVYIDARGVGRKALLKSVGKSALRAKMADGSELLLSNDNGELKQIETSALHGGNVPLALEGRASGSTTPRGGYGYAPYTRSTPGSGRTSPVPPLGYGAGGGAVVGGEKGKRA